MMSHSEILSVVAAHPKVDILKLLATADYDAYKLTKELGLTYRASYLHLDSLERMGLIGMGMFKFHITELGRQILSRI
jgi:predicted transcriptional regulator